jgi:hypothetical protein
MTHIQLINAVIASIESCVSQPFRSKCVVAIRIQVVHVRYDQLHPCRFSWHVALRPDGLLGDQMDSCKLLRFMRKAGLASESN